MWVYMLGPLILLSDAHKTQLGSLADLNDKLTKDFPGAKMAAYYVNASEPGHVELVVGMVLEESQQRPSPAPRAEWLKPVFELMRHADRYIHVLVNKKFQSAGLPELPERFSGHYIHSFELVEPQ